MRIASFALPILTLVLSTPGFADTTPDATTTAQAILLDQTPLLDWTTATAQEQTTALTAEINTVFDAALTDAGKTMFYRAFPFEKGQLLISFDAATTASIVSRLDANEELDISSGLGIAGMDEALQSFHATKLKHAFADDYFISFDENKNPRVLAKLITGNAAVRFAEANEVFSFGEGATLSVLNAIPRVYVFNIGWGDCPSGCIANRRYYFEAPAWGPNAHPTKLGQSGDELSDEGLTAAQAAFKP